jgi:hypothetical protein
MAPYAEQVQHGSVSSRLVTQRFQGAVGPPVTKGLMRHNAQPIGTLFGKCHNHVPSACIVDTSNREPRHVARRLIPF